MQQRLTIDVYAIQPRSEFARSPMNSKTNSCRAMHKSNVHAGSRNVMMTETQFPKSRFARLSARSIKTGLFEIVERQMPRIGDVRFVVEHIDGDRFEEIARKRGWNGEDGMLDYAEHYEAAVHSEHKTLDEAKAAAIAFLAKGNSLFGCCTIDRQVFERFEDDMHPEWERHEMYEVAGDGELMDVAA